MKRDNKQVTENDLQKLVDGELSAAAASAVTTVLSANESLRRKVEEYRDINRRLREIYPEKQADPVPARLLLAVSGGGRSPLVGRIAASLLWLLLGGIIGYSLQNRIDADNFMRPLPVEAAFAHAVFVPEVRHPVEVSAAEQEHLNAWLSKRLDRSIAAPDLRQAGYSLIGGRLLPDGHRPAAQFMYEDTAGQRITLYIRHALDSRKTAFLHAQADGLGIVYWVDDGLAFALTAAASKAALSAAAEIVYRELNP